MGFSKQVRRLRGKYQIAKGTFVTCYLDVLEASEERLRAFVSFSRLPGPTVPIGTRIFFNSEAIPGAPLEAAFAVYSIVVQGIEEAQGQPLLVCSPIDKEVRPNLRTTERKPTEFRVTLPGKADDSVFIAKEGNLKGLTLHHSSKKVILSLALGRVYGFKVEHKGSTFTLPGEVRHIRYDWKTYEHCIGIHFPQLPEQEEVVLNRLLDPTYTIPIAEKHTVDASISKISEAAE
ncbi:MAG TPA: hypothetical protein V6C99_01125 [Oculatellaceae cyanobacterium]|jgi:hypothetical protein